MHAGTSGSSTAIRILLLASVGVVSCSTAPPAPPPVEPPRAAAQVPPAAQVQPAGQAQAGTARIATSWGDPVPLLEFTISEADLAALSQSEPAQAAPTPDLELYPVLTRRFGLSLGAAFYGNFDTTVRVDSGLLLGAILDLEDFLGVDGDSFVGRLDAFYSFSPRHRVDFAIYDINRSGKRTIADDIEIGNIVIPAGEVQTKFDTLIFKAAYRYNFVAEYRTLIGASLGLHTMGIDLGMRSSSFNVQESFNVTAPLPVIGLHGEYALGERWKLLASAEFMEVDLGFVKGRLADTRLGIEHDLFDHFGWGLGYNGFLVDAEFQDDGSSPLSADLEYGYQGLMLYLRGYL